MKIAVTAGGPDLDSNVEARFGRCPYFIIVDSQTMQFEAIENPNIALGGGAGIQSAQLMAEKDVKAVLTGNCGPNAFRVFGSAGIEVVVGQNGSVREAVERFQNGTISTADGPNVASHFGMGSGDDSSAQQFNASSKAGGSMAPGMGGGRGMGGGMGGGRGMGGGQGMGMGGGIAGAMQPGFQQQAWFPDSDVQQQTPPPASAEEELAVLKEQAKAMQSQMTAITTRIHELEKGGNGRVLIAFIDAKLCTGCSNCLSQCPTGALSLVNNCARVDSAKCNGCGQCVAACPRDAIFLKKG